ncbi:MAG: hypothetical protein K2U26_09410 [Cyclobacteriaceae bacterium]|nr:hypothetical protein [Cyclobacteriaceae bacterium]
MKYPIRFNLKIIAVCVLGMLVSCTEKKTGHESLISFQGIVVDSKLSSLDSVEVELQGKTVLTDSKGGFSISAASNSAKYALNFSKKGFGFVSKIYVQSGSGLKITLAKARETKINIRTVEGEVIRIIDTRPEVTSPPSSTVPLGNPLANVPFVYDASGNLIDFKMPSDLKGNYDGLNNFQQPARGAIVEIPKNGLEVNGENPIVEASIQTIDLYSPDGMPGDNTVRTSNGCLGYIRSYGAVNFEISQKGKPIKLKKGAKARIIVPIDTISILTKEPLPKTIPFLTYNRNSGIWEQEGTAILDKSKGYYEAWTTHFSTFNMDMTFGNAASCYQICNSIPSGAFTDLRIEISAPYYHLFSINSTTPCSTSGRCGSNSSFAIVNMGPYSPVGVRLLNYSTTPPELLSTYIFVAGPSVAVADTQCPYDACSGPQVISNSLDQNYVKTDKSGMCHIQLANPQRTTSGSAATYPIKLAWLYDDSFTTSATKKFNVEISTDNSIWSGVIGGTGYTSPDELVHQITTNVTASTKTYFRVYLSDPATNNNVGDPSNVVCIEIDSMGNPTLSTCGVLAVPSACM